jgi:formylglycine-generating enzyme required for sulfatase activity
MFSTPLNKASLPESAGATTSTFAQRFIAALRKPGLTLQEFFEDVGNNVGSASGQQQPFNAMGGGFASFFFREPTPPGPKPGERRPNPKDKQDYVWIPAGGFTMGCTEGDTKCKPNEEPPHSVEISKGFWMGAKEVTVREYMRYIQQQHKRKPQAPSQNRNWNNADFPIVEVTWLDAAGFCAWAGGRLPTEAEWEYAARANTKTIYPWGNEIDRNKARYNHTLLGNAKGDDLWGDLAPVGQYKPNAWGLLDVVGNVLEWCSDWYQKLYDPSPAVDPKGPQTGTGRVLRSGSFHDSELDVRLSSRASLRPGEHQNNVGFRCALDNLPN